MANFTLDYTKIMSGLVPCTTLETILSGETVTIVKPINENFICTIDSEGNDYPKGWEQIIDEQKITDAIAAKKFLDEKCTFGGFRMVIKRDSNEFNEAINFFGKTEKAYKFYQRVLETIMVLTKISVSETMATDAIVGKTLKIWSINNYKVYLDKKTNEWNMACFTNVMFKEPGYDVVAKSEANRLEAVKELADMKSAKPKKDKKSKVTQI